MSVEERPETDWRFIRKNAWRREGPPSWARHYTPLMTFVAQSNASGFRRLFGLFLSISAGVVQDRLAGPLLGRGLKGRRLGLDAKPFSLTGLAWRGSSVASSFRWWLEKHASRFARYNS